MALSDDAGKVQLVPGSSSSPPEPDKTSGIQIVENPSDSVYRKTCHQCRQKTRDSGTLCRNLKKNKPCPIKYCQRCLLNRYGEKAEEVAQLEDWKCPKCRGICNCSFCRKKIGCAPTGILVHKAKATGFSSVSEMLQVMDPDNSVKNVKEMVAYPRKPATPSKESVVVSPRKLGKENSFDGKDDPNLHLEDLTLSPDEKKPKKTTSEELKEHDHNVDNGSCLKKSNLKGLCITNELSNNEAKPEQEDGDILQEKSSETGSSQKVSSDSIEIGENREGDSTICQNMGGLDNAGAKRYKVVKSHTVKNTLKFQNRAFVVDVPLPQGTKLTTVTGIELPPEDVGDALQFLEFCAAFGKAFDLRKGQSESIMQELISGCSKHRGQQSLGVRFHIKLLSLILKDLGQDSRPLSSANGKNSWLVALGQCVSKSQCASKELPSDCFDRGSDGYDELDFSKKIRLLNFLCDEVLCTEKLRSWTDRQNSKFVERVKEAKEKVLAAKDKKKLMKQKLQDETAKAIIAQNSAPILISEHEPTVSKIKTEVAQAHAEMLEAISIVPKRKQRSDAVRTEPLLLDVNGHSFWRLNGYSGEPDILLQDMGTTDEGIHDEKWFSYELGQKKSVEEYISFREKKLRLHTVTEKLPLESAKEEFLHDSMDELQCSTSKIETANAMS